MLQIVLLCLCVTAVTANPDWNSKPYTASGTIILPYGEGIVEPFTAYIDPIAKKSRIDYYGGMNKIIYFNGPGYKIVPSVYHNASVSFLIFHIIFIKDYEAN